jgi:hypothetical protein
VNVLSGAQSVFWWQGEVQEETEALLIAKTTADLVQPLNDLMATVHPYENFELLALPVVAGSSPLSGMDRGIGGPASAGGTKMTEERRETLKGSDVLEQAKRLLHEGNVRKVIVKQDEKVVAEFPLTIGVGVAVLAPVVAAIGALVALLANCTIEVEREPKTPA